MKISGILLFILVIVLLMASYHVIEGFRGGRRGAGGARRAMRRAVARRGGGHRGRRGFRWRRGPRTVVYDSRPYYYGGWRDYYYGLPYLASYMPSWLWGPRCRAGCGYLGNGAVGCVNPTNTPDSCIFASDCYGC